MKNFERERIFVVDNITYVARYTSANDFQFFVDARASRINIPLDPISRAFGDAPETEIWSIFESKHPFAVKREVLRFVHDAIKHFNPHHFTFTANEKAKIPVYTRIANHIAKKYDYYLHAEDGGFAFFKKVVA